MEIEKHSSPEQLIDFLEDRLHPSSREELSLHLKTGCQVCNDSLVLYERMFSAIQSLHWPAPTHSIHKKAVSQFSLYYPEKVKTKPKMLPLFRPAFIGFAFLALVVFTFLFTLNLGVVNAGYIENVIGQVEVFNPSTGKWNPVVQGQTLPIDATIRTLSNSQVTISFPGGERTMLSAESEVYLESIVKSHGLWEISLEQVNGQTENQTSSSTAAFIIKTMAGVINGSKAHFLMAIAADGSVTTDVFEGEINTLSHSEKSIVHSGQTLVFPSNKFATMGTPFIRDTAIAPSFTPMHLDKATKTPNTNGNQGRTPTPKPDPTKKNTPGNSSSSNNSDSSCTPSNSNGNGNSENANNSPESCNQ